MTTPDGPFWELVKAEFRATWRGRWRRIWWLSAALSLLATVLVPAPQFDAAGAFCFLVSLPAGWAPVVLGSDLLCTRFKENPEPHREWPPRAFAARAFARIAPVLAVISADYLVTMLSRGPRVLGETPYWWAATGVSGQLCIFMLAALAGSTTRRPRRFAVGFGTYLVALAVTLWELRPYLATLKLQPAALTSMIVYPYWTGLSMVANRCWGLIAPNPWIPDGDYPLYDLCFRWTLIGVLALCLGLIAHWRTRRHPYTSQPEMTNP